MADRLRKLNVFVSGRHVGVLSEEPIRGAGLPPIPVFKYDSGVEPSDAISLTMPIRAEPYEYDGLPPVLEMNLPEGHRRAEALALGRVTDVDDWGLLALVGRNMLGRLAVSERQILDPTQEAEIDLDRLDAKGREYFLQLYRDAGFRSGISGTQPKTIAKSGGGDDSLPLLLRSSRHIVVKTFDEWDRDAENEYFCLSAVKKAGFKVPGCRLTSHGTVLIVDRFDIRGDNSPLGFEEAIVLRGLHATDKYKGSYEQIAGLIRQYVSPQFRQEGLATLFASVVLSIVLRNSDSHLKNYGFLYETPISEVRVAPLYDITTTSVHPRMSLTTPALSIGGKKVWWDERTLLRFGVLRCGLEESEARDIIQRCMEAAGETANEIVAYISRQKAFETVGRAMVDAWRSEIKRLGTKPGRKGIASKSVEADASQSSRGFGATTESKSDSRHS